MTTAPSHRESDDAYHGIVAVLNDRWRVIVCKGGIQWIVQYRASATETYAGARWASRSYVTTRDALIRLCAEHAGEISPAALAILNTLPSRIDLAGCLRRARAI